MAVSEMPRDEQMRRVRAAIAEAGYPDVAKSVTWDSDEPAGPSVPLGPDGVPDAVCWMAFHVSRLSHCCWSCWRDCEFDTCDHDPYASELPDMAGVGRG
jgi:hypothetical protein